MKHGSLNCRAPFIALILFFISSLFLSAATLQLVKNGDFSNSFTDWSLQSHGSYPQTCTSFAGYGTSIWLVSNSPGVGTASIQQAVAIPMGTESLSFSMNMASWNFDESDGHISVTANGATILSTTASTSAAMTTLTATLNVATYTPGSTVILRINGVIEPITCGQLLDRPRIPRRHGHDPLFHPADRLRHADRRRQSDGRGHRHLFA